MLTLPRRLRFLSRISLLFSNLSLLSTVSGVLTSSGILSFASYKSLNEKSYTGVMAATGLSYLSLIVSIGASGTLLLLA